MFTEIYIEALLVNKELADQIWDLWDAGLINDVCACIVWWRVANHTSGIVDSTIDRAKATNPP